MGRETLLPSKNTSARKPSTKPGSSTRKGNRIVAGTMWMKMGTHSFGTAIDLCDLGLNQIEETDEEFRIGAMVTPAPNGEASRSLPIPAARWKPPSKTS